MPWISDLKERLSCTYGHNPRHLLELGERHVRIGHFSLPWWPFKVKEMPAAEGLMGRAEPSRRGNELIRHHGNVEFNQPGDAVDITSTRRSSDGDKVAENELSALQKLHAQLAGAPKTQKFVADVMRSNDPVYGPLLEAIARKRPLTEKFFENADDPARLVARGFHATEFEEPGTSVLREDGVAHAVARIMYEDMFANHPTGSGRELQQGTMQELTAFRRTQLRTWAGASSARERLLCGWIEQQLSAAFCPTGYTPSGWAKQIAQRALERFDECVQKSLRERLLQREKLPAWIGDLDPKAIPGHLSQVREMVACAIERNDGKLAWIVKSLFPRVGDKWDDSVLALGDRPELWVARALADDGDVFTRFALQGLEVTIEGCTAYVKHRLKGTNPMTLDMSQIGTSLHASLRARLEGEAPPKPEIAHPSKPQASENSKVVEAAEPATTLDWMQALIDEAPDSGAVRDFLLAARDSNDAVLLALLKNLAPGTERMDLHGLGGVSSVSELLARCFTSDRFRRLASALADVVHLNLALDYPQGDEHAPSLVEEQSKHAGFLDRYAGRQTHRQALLASWMHERLKHAKSLPEDAAGDLASQAAQSAMPAFDAQVSHLSAFNAGWKGLRDWMKDVTLASVPTEYPNVRDFIERVVEHKDAAVAQALHVLFPRSRDRSAMHTTLALGGDDPPRLLGLALAADPQVRTRMALLGLTGSLKDCEAYVGNLLHKSTTILNAPVVIAFAQVAGRTLHEQLNAAQGKGKQAEDGKPAAEAT